MAPPAALLFALCVMSAHAIAPSFPNVQTKIPGVTIEVNSVSNAIAALTRACAVVKDDKTRTYSIDGQLTRTFYLTRCAGLTPTREGAGGRRAQVGRRMDTSTFAAASFTLLRDATAAIDWFCNQAIAPESIVVAAQPPGEQLRAPQRGDNARDDLTWIVAIDLRGAALPRSVVRDTFQREGGKNLSRVPMLPVLAERT